MAGAKAPSGLAINPARIDHRKGSFKVNLRTGAWADFAVNHRGGDLVALAAYLVRISQREAAVKVAEMVGVDPYERLIRLHRSAPAARRPLRAPRNARCR